MKKPIFGTAILFSLLAFCVFNSFAQTKKIHNIDAPVVNGMAIHLEKPEYPAAAKAVNAEGIVNVKVIIDEKGKVVSAESVSGHALLRKSSEIAALKSTFKPGMRDGKPIKFEGIIVYNFLAGEAVSTGPNFEDYSKFGEVLNFKALSLPAPKYPAAAKAVKAVGTVIVEIIVDEKGEVTSAKAVSGHPLLLKEAEKAALKAKFEPELVNGKAVKIKGVVVYKFLAH
ncbi:MAG: TonB family protein [Pyrinomonadaceae bacterium]|nr:TonB family protein [Pyrinomonadaceae bacterium]